MASSQSRRLIMVTLSSRFAIHHEKRSSALAEDCFGRRQVLEDRCLWKGSGEGWFQCLQPPYSTVPGLATCCIQDSANMDSTNGDVQDASAILASIEPPPLGTSHAHYRAQSIFMCCSSDQRTRRDRVVRSTRTKDS
uniref:Secreted protein n=1 Tax=Steinernema glaseri TaxID=37863 RepID=A0A1I8A2B3_9BILA